MLAVGIAEKRLEGAVSAVKGERESGVPDEAVSSLISSIRSRRLFPVTSPLNRDLRVVPAPSRFFFRKSAFESRDFGPCKDAGFLAVVACPGNAFPGARMVPAKGSKGA